MTKSKVYLNFYGISILLTGDEEVLRLLTRDFEFFIPAIEPTGVAMYTFQIFRQKPDYSLIDGLVASRQSINSVTYDVENIRYNDYYSNALTIYDYHKEEGQIYSLDASLLHEITYLMILSRTGKKLDDLGLHKVHAMAVKYHQTALVLMMPMKGGKSTLFVDLIKNNDIEVISDDTPLVGSSGDCYPFPLRVGLHDIERLPDGDRSLIYSLNRPLFGRKNLVPMKYFKNNVAKKSTKVILMEGFRVQSDTCVILKSNSFVAFNSLIKHMIVGVGLPIIIEYFLEYNLKDSMRNLKILVYRLVAALNLARRSKFYKVLLGRDRDTNSSTIYNHLKKVDNDF